MSVKNCSRDVLVSRNNSQMDLDESLSTSACRRLFGDLISRNVFVFNENLLVYFGKMYVS